MALLSKCIVLNSKVYKLQYIDCFMDLTTVQKVGKNGNSLTINIPMKITRINGYKKGDYIVITFGKKAIKEFGELDKDKNKIIIDDIKEEKGLDEDEDDEEEYFDDEDDEDNEDDEEEEKVYDLPDID